MVSPRPPIPRPPIPCPPVPRPLVPRPLDSPTLPTLATMSTSQIISAGDLLMDLLSTEYAETFASADTYQRLPGGSPANLAMNLAQLGVSVALVAAVGQDDAGTLLLEEVRRRGVDVSMVARVAEPTTLILVTKSKAVSDFEAYRSADVQLSTQQLDGQALRACKVFHTTAFALSQEPARATILAAAAQAAAAGARLSIDVNYARKIWPDRLEALWVITSYLAAAHPDRPPLVKCSEVDFARLFDEPLEDHEEAVAQLQDLGAGVVCLTLGEEGCYVSDGQEAFSQGVRPVQVRDTTGAGDAFWSGFLAAHVAGHDWRACAQVGRGVAERKLQTVGPLDEQLQLSDLLEK